MVNYMTLPQQTRYSEALYVMRYAVATVFRKKRNVLLKPVFISSLDIYDVFLLACFSVSGMHDEIATKVSLVFHAKKSYASDASVRPTDREPEPAMLLQTMWSILLWRMEFIHLT